MSPVPRRRSVRCVSGQGLHRIAYLEWGDPGNKRVLVCVHGLTRCARDFDLLAGELAERYRVICPDMAGRGDSDWLADPMLYVLPQYVADVVTLIARLDVESVHWLGTSMGGLIGMALAAQRDTPVTKLVLNDAGPVVSKVSLERIAAYVGLAPIFPDLDAAQQYVRAVAAPFGPHSDAEWRFLTEVVVRPCSRRRLPHALRSAPGRAVPRPHAGKATSSCGRSTRRCAVRPWCCAARNRTCSRARPASGWPPAGRRRRWSKSPASATRRPCCTGTRSHW